MDSRLVDRFHRAPEPRHRRIPASLALISLAIAFGPWSAGAVSKRSQLARAARMLQTRGLWNGNRAQVPNHKIELPHEEGENFRSTIDYLIRMHGAASVQPLFAKVLPQEHWSKLQHRNGAIAIMDALQIAVAQDVSSRSYNRKRDAASDVAGFRHLWQVTGTYPGGCGQASPTVRRARSRRAEICNR